MNRQLKQGTLNGRPRPRKVSPLIIMASLATTGLVAFAIVKVRPRVTPSELPASRTATESSTAGRRSARVALSAEAPAPITPESPSTAAPMPEIVPSKRSPQETICTQDGCVGPEYAKQRTRRLLEEDPGRFTAEQAAILTAYTVDGLGQAVRDAEARFLQATDATRDRDGEYYRRVLDLVALVAKDPPSRMSDRERRAYEDYAEALRKAESTFAKMSPAAAERERARIKEGIFAGAQPGR